ncbi:Bgt-20250, partial [Blumeria graminis f. sp. tritici]
FEPHSNIRLHPQRNSPSFSFNLYPPFPSTSHISARPSLYHRHHSLSICSICCRLHSNRLPFLSTSKQLLSSSPHFLFQHSSRRSLAGHLLTQIPN